MEASASSLLCLSFLSGSKYVAGWCGSIYFHSTHTHTVMTEHFAGDRSCSVGLRRRHADSAAHRAADHRSKGLAVVHAYIRLPCFRLSVGWGDVHHSPHSGEAAPQVCGQGGRLDADILILGTSYIFLLTGVLISNSLSIFKCLIY